MRSFDSLTSIPGFLPMITLIYHFVSSLSDLIIKGKNGTAATVYIKHSAVPLSESANHNLQEICTAGLKNPLTLLDVTDLTYKSFPIINSHMVYHVLHFLLSSTSKPMNPMIVKLYYPLLLSISSLLDMITSHCNTSWAQSISLKQAMMTIVNLSKSGYTGCILMLRMYRLN